MRFHDLSPAFVGALLLALSQGQSPDHPPYPQGLPPTNAATCVKDNGHVGDRTTQQACDDFGSGTYKTGTDPATGYGWKACISDDFGPDDLDAWQDSCQQFSGHGRICYYQDVQTKDPDSFICVNADCYAEQTCVKGGSNVDCGAGGGQCSKGLLGDG